jgi:zinc transport system ATP-binding protein
VNCCQHSASDDGARGAPVGRREGPVLISVEGLGVAFGNFWALRGIDLAIRDGEIFAFIGPNGAGKSTLLKVLAGLQAPTVGLLKRGETPCPVGYVPQKLAFDLTFPITVGEFLSVNHPGRFLWWGGVNKSHRDEIVAVLDRLQAGGVLNQKLGTLSGGQLQRVLIASAILQKPRLLLLDEPSASIDRRGAEELRELLRRLHAEDGMAIVFVSHDLHFVDRLAQEVLCLNQTCCAIGPPADVLTDHHLSTTFGGVAGSGWHAGLHTSSPETRETPAQS